MAKKRDGVHLTVAEIEERFELAALTLRRLPAKDGPRGYGSSWPEALQSRFTAYGFEEARMRVVPSAADIQLMEDTIEWLMLLEAADDRRIVWMRADNFRWRAICNRVGLSRSHAWRRWSAALITIQRRLEKPTRSKTGLVGADRSSKTASSGTKAQEAGKSGR